MRPSTMMGRSNMTAGSTILGATPVSTADGEPTARYGEVRRQTEKLCEPLETEDYVVSSMVDVSPTKWHLAHTSWFFETFLLGPHAKSYRSPDPRYAYLFNSYYVQAGERHCRAKRGLATRPTVEDVYAYREHVDDAMQRLITEIASDAEHPAARLIELGLQHEQQHQELLLTDIKHVFWTNPMRPVYRAGADTRSGDGAAAQSGAVPTSPSPLRWHQTSEGVYSIGLCGDGFAFDNEGPRHRVFLEAFKLASRLVTNREYLEFMRDGGYSRAQFWLSTGWATVQDRGWDSPLYWERDSDGQWTEFTLSGAHPVEDNRLDEPVTHVSYFEADAFARWAGARLPTEFEWEAAAAEKPVDGNFVEREFYHPQPVPLSARDDGLQQLYGDAWQWTQSAYVGYPNYEPEPGAIGEYNGKWMSDQWVLRGASCATPQSHIRHTYRNFFPSDARWQFSSIRLASGARARV